MLARKHPELKEAVYCAKKMSLIEKWRDYQFHKNLHKVDERMLLEQARIDGRAQGLAEGRTEGKAQGLAEGKAQGLTAGKAEGKAEGLTEGREDEKLEIARKLKSMGLPSAKITEGTGLSVEIVEKL